MLRGRLGLETARIPHADRHGLLWLSRGALTVRDGTLRFERQGPPGDGTALESGEYGIPFQSLSMILLGPGSTVSHDALRLMARHGTALVAVGEDGVRCYTAPPLMPDTSDVARRQMRAWADPAGGRITIARKMYALRLGEVLPQQDISALRGVEGARMRQTYRLVAQRYGINWRRRSYDRTDPLWADLPNQAINHASVAVTSAAVVAVTAIGAIPQLGFIHEHSGEAFPLDIADLFRDTILLPAAFQSARAVMDQPHLDIERHTRRTTGDILRKERVISKMIDRIKTLFQDVPPLEMGPDGPAGDWQAARDLDEADIYQAAVEEGTYQGSGGEASQGQGDAP
jgi:CRISPR-associated protein Cas1